MTKQVKYTFRSDRDFRRNVDRNVRDVLRLLAKGVTNVFDLADASGLSTSSVTTIKGNVRRGYYAPNATVRG